MTTDATSRFCVSIQGILLILLLLFLLPPLSVATQGKRVALVVGNSDYKHADRLPNAYNDARDIHSILAELGFAVEPLQIDLSERELRHAFNTFTNKADGAEMAVFYYAGHGAQASDNKGYLLPVDTSYTHASDIISYGVPVDWLVDNIAGAGSKQSLLILDACRNLSLPKTWEKKTRGTRSAGYCMG